MCVCAGHSVFWVWLHGLTDWPAGLKWLTTFFTVVLLACLVDYYRYQLVLERQRLRAPALQLYHVKKLAVAMLIELTVCSIHPLPFVTNPDALFGERKAVRYAARPLHPLSPPD